MCINKLCGTYNCLSHEVCSSLYVVCLWYLLPTNNDYININMTLSTERIGYNIWKVCHQAFQRYLSLLLVCFDSSSVDTQCPFVMVFTISLYKQAIYYLTFMQ